MIFLNSGVFPRIFECLHAPCQICCPQSPIMNTWMLYFFRLLIPVSMIICNDVMAYMFGFFFGKTPLIKLSPKKTWEGFIGGALSTVVFGIVVSRYMFIHLDHIKNTSTCEFSTNLMLWTSFVLTWYGKNPLSWHKASLYTIIYNRNIVCSTFLSRIFMYTVEPHLLVPKHVSG